MEMSSLNGLSSGQTPGNAATGRAHQRKPGASPTPTATRTTYMSASRSPTGPSWARKTSAATPTRQSGSSVSGANWTFKAPATRNRGCRLKSDCWRLLTPSTPPRRSLSTLAAAFTCGGCSPGRGYSRTTPSVTRPRSLKCLGRPRYDGRLSSPSTPTHDLARVLRVADTKNHKGQEPVPVTILKADGPRLAVEDWQNLAKGWPPAKEKTRKPKDDAGPQSGPSFTINPNAKPDADWLETLRAVDSIRDTLDDRRGFPSPSECDMSLTSSLARVPDMTDQSIIDLCVWHRRVKHNKPPSHRKAYETTLRKARTAAEDDDDDTPTMTAEDMEIVKILQVCDGDGTPPRYRFVTPSGSMTLPDGSHILEQRKFRIALLNTFKVALRSLRNENWEPFVQRKLTPKIETTHPGDPDYPQRGARDETLEWIADYLDSRMAEIEGGDDVTDAPFKMNGVEHIMPAHFNERLKTNRNETFTNHGLHLRLSDVGWHSKKVRIPKGPTVNRWVLDASRARTQTCGHPREETPEHAEQAS